MKAGRLRHRVTIQNFTSSRNASGQPVQTWSDIATVWAEVKGISGRELLAAGAEMSEVTVRVWLRYRDDVTSASRLVYDGLVYNIQSVIPDAKRTQLEILCKQGVAQ